jgi:Macro domain
MGICCNYNPPCKNAQVCEYSINDFSVKVCTGNILLEPLEGIIIPSNSILKLDLIYLTTDTIKLQKDCIKHIKSKGKLSPGDIFITSGLKCKHIVYAVCPMYKDGTQAESDYLKQAYSSSIAYLTSLGLQKIGISLDWVYPKQLLVQTVLGEVLSLKRALEVYLFSNNPHQVLSR